MVGVGVTVGVGVLVGVGVTVGVGVEMGPTGVGVTVGVGNIPAARLLDGSIQEASFTFWQNSPASQVLSAQETFTITLFTPTVQPSFTTSTVLMKTLSIFGLVQLSGSTAEPSWAESLDRQ